MSWFVYVVEGNYKPPNAHASMLYCGISKNVDKRVEVHNRGKGAKAVKGYLPVRLVASWKYPDKSTALKAEYAFKKLTRLQKQIYVNNPETWNADEHRKN